MPDYAKRIRDLRRLGAPGSGATEPERKLANAKADELERKYGKPVSVSSPFTNDTVTSRDGRSYGAGRAGKSHFDWGPYLDDLLRRQHRWNPPDEADLVEDDYKYDDPRFSDTYDDPRFDEDYGYDLFEGDDYG